MSIAESPSRFVTTQPMPARAPARSLVGQSLRTPERKRLEAALAVDSARLHELEALRTRGVTWAAAALPLYARASEEARAGDLDSGWKLLHEARRLCVAGMPEGELDVQLVAIAKEAEAKLASWRRDTVRTLVGALGSTASLEAKQHALRTAMRIRDEHSDNVYYRNRLLRRQMAVVSVVLVLLGGGLMAVLYREPSLSTLLSLTQPNVRALVAAMCAGGLGSCLSALITFSTGSGELHVAEHLANVLITITRPLIGIVSGLVAVLLLYSGVLKLGPNALLVPFAFGFSERLVIGALEKLQPRV